MIDANRNTIAETAANRNQCADHVRNHKAQRGTQKSALSRFLRRLRFIVQFPFPDAAHRADIWQRIFPDDAPTRMLDYTQLAQLNLAGGHIRNVALAGAFIAADRGEPIGMGHLAEAARSEYVKLERTLTDAETRGWA